MSANASWDISRSKRECASSGITLEEGDTFYAAIREEGESFVREDFSAKAWEEVDTSPYFSYWKSKITSEENRKNKRLIVDVEAFYAFFTDLGEPDKPHRQLFRYLIALLLVRKRVLRLDEIEKSDEGEALILFDNRAKREVRVFTPLATPTQLEEAQEELNQIFECQLSDA